MNPGYSWNWAQNGVKKFKISLVEEDQQSPEFEIEWQQENFPRILSNFERDDFVDFQGKRLV